MNPEDLRRQNEELGEQIKLLVKTEKRLYLAQRTIERQLERTKLLNRFALESSRSGECREILELAIGMLLRLLRVDQGAAFLAGPGDSWAATAHGHAPGFDPEGAGRATTARIAGLPLERPTVFTPGSRPAAAGVAALLRAAASIFDSAESPEAPAIEIVLPLRRRDGTRLGAVVLRTLDTVVSHHEQLPSEQDVPFLELVCAHVETAVDSVLLHRELAAFAAGLEAKVEERTRDLEAAREQADVSRQQAEALSESLRQLFDHMRQAIVAFGPDGRIVGQCSRQASIVFGKPDLEGETIVDLLFAGVPSFDVERTSFEEWLQASFEVAGDAWDHVNELAPRDLTIRPGTPDERYLVLEFRRMRDERRGIDCVMMLATDETEKWRLEKMSRGKEIEHEQRLAAMRRLVAGGAQLFVQFMEATAARLARLSDVIDGTAADGASLTPGDVEYVFQQVHTIKGEARTFGLDDLETESAALEEKLIVLRSGSKTAEAAEAAAALREHVAAYQARARESLARGRHLLVEASPIGSAVLEQVTVNRSDVRELERTVSALDGGADPGVAAVRAIAARLTSRPFGELVEPLVDAAPRWAERYGKQVSVVVEGHTHPVPPRLIPSLRGALTHMVRNAIAHGIETPRERERAGKAPLGRIRIVCSTEGGTVGVVVEDDGAGIDVEGLRERALAVGNAPPTDDVDLVFASGVSTSKYRDELSGRGVGLIAARKDLASVGYRIDVATEKGCWTRFAVREGA
jgi:HPt (histidine-containing phosphotransfer) domain-containing protein/PAS domain-containing protein